LLRQARILIVGATTEGIGVPMCVDAHDHRRRRMLDQLRRGGPPMHRGVSGRPGGRGDSINGAIRGRLMIVAADE
jgi:ribosomal protein S6E (S10)